MERLLYLLGLCAALAFLAVLYTISTWEPSPLPCPPWLPQGTPPSCGPRPIPFGCLDADCTTPMPSATA